MLKKLRRKVYRKIRFQTWYRKAYYYHRKRRDLDKTIAQYRSVDVLSDKKRLYRLRRDMIRSLFRYGSYYNEYFLFGYEGKDAAYRDGFITEGIRMDDIVRNTKAEVQRLRYDADGCLMLVEDGK